MTKRGNGHMLNRVRSKSHKIFYLDTSFILFFYVISATDNNEHRKTSTNYNALFKNEIELNSSNLSIFLTYQSM